jgi:hypothetical protein
MDKKAFLEKLNDNKIMLIECPYCENKKHKFEIPFSSILEGKSKFTLECPITGKEFTKEIFNENTLVALWARQPSLKKDNVKHILKVVASKKKETLKKTAKRNATLKNVSIKNKKKR